MPIDFSKLPDSINFNELPDQSETRLDLSGLPDQSVANKIEPEVKSFINQKTAKSEDFTEARSFAGRFLEGITTPYDWAKPIVESNVRKSGIPEGHPMREMYRDTLGGAFSPLGIGSELLAGVGLIGGTAKYLNRGTKISKVISPINEIPVKRPTGLPEANLGSPIYDESGRLLSFEPITDPAYMAHRASSRGKFGDTPDVVRQAEAPVVTEKPNFINPFEKAKVESPVLDASSKGIASAPIKSVGERLKEIIPKAQAKIIEQEGIYKTERADRFVKARGVKTSGVAGYQEELGKLKGEYPKVTIDNLKLNQAETDTLFDQIKSLISDEPTSIRARGAIDKLTRGDVPQQNELDLIEEILSLTEREKGTPKLLVARNKLRDWYDLSRGLMGVDIPFMTSAAFRQTSTLAGSKRWFQAYGNSIKAFKNEAVYDKIMDAIEQSPIHRSKFIGNKVSTIADEIGLAQSDLKTLTSRDEQIRSVLAERIPIYGKLVRANNRAFTAFLNTARTKTAEDWLKAAGAITKDGNIINLEEGKRIANTINELTGHGSLKIKVPFSRFSKTTNELNLEKSRDSLSLVFWTPSLIARDAKMMNPLNYMKNDKLVRLKYLEGAVRRAGVWATFTGLASLIPGANVNSNPTSSDFGKVRVGNTRADAGSGLLQWIVMSTRQALGKSTSSSSGRTTELGSQFGSKTRGDVASEFMKYKLHPTLSLPVRAMTATKGAPFYPLSEVTERVSPIPTGDIIDLMKSDPDIEQILLGLISSSLAMGGSTYGPRDFGKPQYEIPGDIRFEGGKLIK